MSVAHEIDLAGKKIKFEFNKFAKQANGSVLVSCGDTQVLVTATANEAPIENQDFFPLTVDYIEKFYSVGRIPGGFFKRETKPSDREVLIARVIDRPLRPSFPEEYRCETHIVCTVLSYDPNHHPAPLALIGASTALMISDIPFNGPVASLRLGLKNGEYIVDPDPRVITDLDLNIAARPGAVLMVEAGANFLSEDQMIDAISYAHKLMEPVFELQEKVRKEIGRPKRKIEKTEQPSDLVQKVRDLALPKMKEAFSIRPKLERRDAFREMHTQLEEQINPEGDEKISKGISKILGDLEYTYVRDLVLNKKQRIDGRSFDAIRPISCEVGVLKRPHGSALFQRGETQALAIVTLGAGDDEQKLDSILSSTDTKKFFLHYNFPPFSVGEAKRLGSPGRREVGHGALAERALSKVLPDGKDFGYTIRLVSEVLESNGSSSMATVCSGTMALLNAGVPILEPVAGIAMGLVKEGSAYAILSDILGDEDHLGDMDFKVCGTKNGITALQMDIKIDGLSREIMKEALEQAKKGRQFILGKLTEAISSPNELSQFAPRIFQIKINPEKIRDLIGPGGKMIKSIVAETGVKIDVDDHGLVQIISPDVPSAENAKRIIRSITAEPEIGGIYMGTVKKIMDFGAFVEIKPGCEGLCHISQLSDKRVQTVNEVVREGEQILVKILDIDKQGKIRLSRKDALGKKPTVQP